MDVEKNEARSTKHDAALATQRTSGLLLIFSCFLLVEGVVRVVSTAPTPSGMWKGGDGVFPPIVLMVGAVIELWFSMLGVVVGAASLILNKRSVAVCAVLCVSILSGWFTFIVYTIAAPAYTASHATAMSAGSLTLQQLRVATTFGEILASIAYCFVMQGGQFYFSLTLLTEAREHSAILAYNAKPKQKVRLLVYSGMVTLGGIGILVLGCLLRSAVGPGRYPMPMVFPPNVVLYPEMTIVSGILVLLYGVMGLTLAASGRGGLSGFAAYGCFTWCWLISAHICGQLGLIGMPVAGPATQLACLSTSLILMPLYFASETLGGGDE